MKGQKYDTGSKPAIAALGCTLVEVHSNQHGKDLFYDLFRVGDDGKFSSLVIGKHYDTGSSPTIAALPDSNTLVEIHTLASNLCYSVGQLKGAMINWSPKGKVYNSSGDNANPAVVVTKSNVVVEVHNGGSGGKHLYYRVGRLEVATGINWQGSVPTYDEGKNPALCITAENQVIEIHESLSANGLCYSIGKLDPDNLTLTWLLIGNRFDTGKNPSVTEGSVGLLMEVHNSVSGKTNLYYRVGNLKENYIEWSGTGGTQYDTGETPSLTSVPGTYGVIAECHKGYLSNFNLYQTSMFFCAELVDIEYGTAVASKPEPFAIAETDFDNSAETSLTQEWVLEEVVGASNTYNWERSTHVGLKVSSDIGFLGAGSSAEVDVSVDFVTGEESTISKTFTWSMTQTVELSPAAGRVHYKATIIRVPTTVPFTATFKRGDLQWKTSGEVEVSHGIIYADIDST